MTRPPAAFDRFRHHGNVRADTAMVRETRNPFTRTMFQHLNAAAGEPFVLVALRFGARPVASDQPFVPVGDEVLASLVERLLARLPGPWLCGSLGDHGVLGLYAPSQESETAVTGAYALLDDCCRYSVLVQRQCHEPRWRAGIARYPLDGHAPLRLIRHARDQLDGQTGWTGGLDRPAVAVGGDDRLTGNRPAAGDASAPGSSRHRMLALID